MMWLAFFFNLLIGIIKMILISIDFKDNAIVLNYIMYVFGNELFYIYSVFATKMLQIDEIDLLFMSINRWC